MKTQNIQRCSACGQDHHEITVRESSEPNCIWEFDCPENGITVYGMVREATPEEIKQFRFGGSYADAFAETGEEKQ